VHLKELANPPCGFRMLSEMKEATVRFEEFVPVLALFYKVGIERGVQRLGHSCKMVFLNAPFVFNFRFKQPETDEESGHLWHR